MPRAVGQQMYLRRLGESLDRCCRRGSRSFAVGAGGAEPRIGFVALASAVPIFVFGWRLRRGRRLQAGSFTVGIRALVGCLAGVLGGWWGCWIVFCERAIDDDSDRHQLVIVRPPGHEGFSHGQHIFVGFCRILRGCRECLRVIHGDSVLLGIAVPPERSLIFNLRRPSLIDGHREHCSGRAGMMVSRDDPGVWFSQLNRLSVAGKSLGSYVAFPTALSPRLDRLSQEFTESPCRTL